MQVAVICAEPERSRNDPDSVASVLTDLGCDVVLLRFDLTRVIDPSPRRARAAIGGRVADLVVIEAGDELMRAQRALRKLDAEIAYAETPVLLAVTVARLSALDFGLGFDDFVLMPLVPAEIHARLRQLDWRTASFGSDEVLKLGDLVIDVGGYEARIGGRPLSLTHQEFELLRFLAQQLGRVFTRDQLLERVWGAEYDGGSRTVDIHVRRLRVKLGGVAHLIETVRNVGYKMQGPS